MQTLTVEQTASLLHMTAKQVQRLARAGQLPAVRVGRRWLFPSDEIDRLLGGRTAIATPAAAALATSVRRPAFELSARNHLRGIVSHLNVEGLMAEVHLQIGEQTLVSIITRASAERLGLRVGGEAVAVIKSTEVMIGSYEVVD